MTEWLLSFFVKTISWGGYFESRIEVSGRVVVQQCGTGTTTGFHRKTIGFPGPKKVKKPLTQEEVARRQQMPFRMAKF